MEEGSGVKVHADQAIHFLQLAGMQEVVGENKYEMSLLTATAGGGGTAHKAGGKANSQLSKVRIDFRTVIFHYRWN